MMTDGQHDYILDAQNNGKINSNTVIQKNFKTRIKTLKIKGNNTVPPIFLGYLPSYDKSSTLYFAETFILVFNFARHEIFWG